MSSKTNAQVANAIGITFQEDCPYCGTKSVAFTIHEGIKWRVRCFDVFAECGFCHRGVVAEFRGPDLHGDASSTLLAAAIKANRPRAMFPMRFSPSAPPHTPPNVARYFIQGMDNLAKNWDAAGMMFRETLEEALKELLPDLSGKSLSSRIKEAAAQQALTPDLADWSHHIRLEGNKAAHDGPYKEEEARELGAFTEMVLRYLFTLPGMVKEKRGQAQKEEPPSVGITLD